MVAQYASYVGLISDINTAMFNNKECGTVHGVLHKKLTQYRT